MKKAFYILTATTISFFGFAQKKQQKPIDESTAINSTFEKYRQAITEANGQEAVKYIDSRTIDYYTNILGWAKHADSLQVESLPGLDKLALLTIRQKATKEQILSFDGKSLFVYSVSIGLVGKNPIVHNTIGNISIKGNTAQAQLFALSKPEAFYFQFYKENEWKINLTSIYIVAESKFKEMAVQQNITETQLVLSIMEKNAKEKPGSEIWKAIN